MPDDDTQRDRLAEPWTSSGDDHDGRTEEAAGRARRAVEEDEAGGTTAEELAARRDADGDEQRP